MLLRLRRLLLFVRRAHLSFGTIVLGEWRGAVVHVVGCSLLSINKLLVHMAVTDRPTGTKLRILLIVLREWDLSYLNSLRTSSIRLHLHRLTIHMDSDKV